MKRFLMWVLPLLVAIPVFMGTVVFLNQKTGKGALQVTSSPDASVYLDGKLIGKTPLCKCETADMLSVGDHVVRLVPASGNFLPFEQKITIYKSVLSVVDRSFGQGASSSGSTITLTPGDPNTAQFSAISFPDSAQVLMDGTPVGNTSLLLNSVTASDHELIFKKDGYNDKVFKVKAVKGYKLSAIVYLGISDIVASTSASIATASAVPTVAQVLILDTPTGFLNVRKSASLSGPIIQKVNPGEKYDLISEAAGWYEIKLSSGSATLETGWVNSQYASKK